MKQDQADQAANPTAARQRRFWLSEEKRQMVAESFTPGESVSKVAQRYRVNANLLFNLEVSGGKQQCSRRCGAVEALPVTVAGAGTATALSRQR